MDPIIPTPPPWKLKADVYIINFWNRQGNLPDFAYSPLEASLPAYTDEQQAGKHVGGISQFQVIRYHESPVGPYDEMLVCPGSFRCMVEGKNGALRRRTNPRITRIYVSQENTCWNGRTNWNIPKHLARFEFKDLAGSGLSVAIYPHDSTHPYDPTEASPSSTPFFQTTIQPVSWLPAFPFSLGWLSYFKDIDLVQPPLPAGEESAHGELPGTERWCAVLPAQRTRRAMLSWADMRQGMEDQEEDGEEEERKGKEEHFWPRLGRWQLTLAMKGADVEFGVGRHWDVPKACP